MKLCPKCEADKALDQAQQIVGLERTAGENLYAEACGYLEAVVDKLGACELSLCDQHRCPNSGGGK